MEANSQEFAWANNFGDEYTKRSPGDPESNHALFAEIFEGMDGWINSAVEFGCGTGANLKALEMLGIPDLAGVDINREAILEASRRVPRAQYRLTSVHDWYPPVESWDLAFTKGFLIHIPPDQLPDVYAKIYMASKRWILLCEYYNPVPVEVPYRGQNGMLWKRDFAGDMLERWKDLQLLSYGFSYRRDPYPQDDITWFLMGKPA